MLPHPLFGDPDVFFVELLCPLYEAVQKDENPVGVGEIKNAYEIRKGGNHYAGQGRSNRWLDRRFLW
jgi:hypothetical protein